MKIRIYDANQRNNLTSGYGLMSRQIVDNLASLGHSICFFPDDGKGEDVILWIRPPHYLKYPEFNLNKKNVIFTMHEKETFEGWKSDWPELLNKVDAVITPTEWNKQVFIKNGVTKPIFVVPLGVNPNDFHGAKDYIFSILTLHDKLGSDNSRENWKDTITAYYKAFKDNNSSSVSLTIKSYNIDRSKYELFINDLKNKFSGNNFPPINILDVNLVAQSLNDLYSNHWLFIKNANREGWSLPLIEAMSCGLPIAHTNIPVLDWTKDYKERCVFKIGDVEGLKNILLDRFRHWKREKGYINQFKWKNCAKGVENVIKSI